MENVFSIKIPAGRRAGKYLRKKAPEGFGDDFSSLVQSLEYHIVIAKDRKAWIAAAKSCYSCQSSTTRHMETYADVWSSIQDVDLVVLVDDEGNIMARALVNLVRMTHAPVYGELHYLLRSRMEYAGLQEGALAPPEVVEDVTERVENARFAKLVLTSTPSNLEDYYEVDGWVCSTESTLYNDSEHRFIKCNIYAPKGWVKK